MTLWPIELSAARILQLRAGPAARRSSAWRTGVAQRPARSRCARTRGLRLLAAPLRRGCSSSSTAPTNVSGPLYELVHGQCIGALVLSKAKPRADHRRPAAGEHPARSASTTRRRCCPYDRRSFQGYRLLREYFAFAERFQFFGVRGLRRGLRRIAGRECELVLLFDAQPAARSSRACRCDSLALYCDAGGQPVRAPRRPDPPVGGATSSTSWSSTGRGRWISRSSRSPASGAWATSAARDDRVPAVLRRLRPSRRRRRRARTTRCGASRACCRSASGGTGTAAATSAAKCSCRWSIARGAVPVDDAAARGRGAGHQSRPAAAAADRLAQRAELQDRPQPVAADPRLAGPSRPRAGLAEGDYRLAAGEPPVAQLPVAARSRRRSGARRAAALRELLALYADPATPRMRKRIEALSGVDAKPVVRRLPLAGPDHIRTRPRHRAAGERGRRSAAPAASSWVRCWRSSWPGTCRSTRSRRRCSIRRAEGR